MAALGLDPLHYLNSRDITEQIMWAELTNRIGIEKHILDNNLAIEIANAVSKLFKK